MKRAIACGLAVLLVGAAILYGRTEDRSGVAIVVTVVLAVGLLELAARKRHRRYRSRMRRNGYGRSR